MFHYPFFRHLIGSAVILTTIVSCNNAEYAEAGNRDSVGKAQSVNSMVLMDRNETLESALDSLANIDSVNQFAPVPMQLQDEAYQLRRQFMATAPKLSVGRRTYYIVEGDLRYDKDELLNYFLLRLQNRDNNYAKRKEYGTLTVATEGGVINIWEPQKVIRYTVNRSSFSNKKEYDEVVRNMRTATADWMRVCNVTFRYLPQLDNTEIDLDEEGTTRVDFCVRQLNANGRFIAQAFFPRDPAYKHMVYLDPSYFTTSISRVGILRHELGHVLGFRHEHIWSSHNECAGEDIIEGHLGAEQVTQYDPWSVMHYLCGKGGSEKLEITAFDIEGSVKIYGPPMATASR